MLFFTDKREYMNNSSNNEKEKQENQNDIPSINIDNIENLNIEEVNMYQIGYNKAIDEFAEALKERLKGMQMVELQGEDVCPCAETGEECPYINQDIGCQYCAREQTIKDILEIAEQLKSE
jgi:hypothetical protein